ncbi:hypothetical protein CIB95_00325 [Lottiidibacillus patelloidae]|uniref:YetF C-terminal domain-containing protein n=1 Tax=Lottiidibacillus patelloidae TaxID=2670334 RepID=A0A263BWE7_9BACI|nr:DUF421 domain-containing protein [Lottiidibacillus patelloidae]OZM58059.1 hypothetical protein CIB95_00325 [Lottiidibacillus patelloidae]
MEAYLETAGKAFILFTVGILFLRVAGRKSISQMTLAQTVIMISLGSIIIQPITDKSIGRTAVATGILVVSLIIVEYLQVKSNAFEKFITGKAKVVIENGQPVEETLKKLRLTVDQLEIRLRQQGIGEISDVKTATLEANGQLGYELIREAKPLTIGEFEKLMDNYMKSNQPVNSPLFNQLHQEQNQKQKQQPQQNGNIFGEVKQNQNNNPNPTHLQ